MPMLERLELARAVAARQSAGEARFVQVEDWRPLLEFSQGNPLTVTILVRQALRDHRTTRAQIGEFVAELRNGAARLADDPAQGRGASFAASLDYGFSEGFTDAERAQLALLALFQGIVRVGVLRVMGKPGFSWQPVEAVRGLSSPQGIALLDRAADAGLLTKLTGDYYAVHPAVPWYLQQLFERYHEPAGSVSAVAVLHAWTGAIASLADYYHDQSDEGHAEATSALAAQEANLLRARQVALEHGWHEMVMGSMQGLNVLYGKTGRAIEWRYLVDELVPSLTDTASGGPLPGHEEQWNMLTEYRVHLAIQDRAWPVAQQLLQAMIAWRREHCAGALVAAPADLDDLQRKAIHNLAVSLQLLGHVHGEQEDPGCVSAFMEAAELCRRIGDRRGEGIMAVHLANVYKDIPEIRDLGEAERWYRRDLALLEEHDTLGRAATIAQLGALAYARYRESISARAPSEADQHLNEAFNAYREAIDLFPATASAELAVIHNMFGLMLTDIGEYDQAVQQYQKSIQYYENLGDRYGAGNTRYNATLAYSRAGRRDSALLYASTALSDYESVGPEAADKINRQHRLIADLEQGRPV